MKQVKRVTSLINKIVENLKLTKETKEIESSNAILSVGSMALHDELLLVKGTWVAVTWAAVISAVVTWVVVTVVAVMAAVTVGAKIRGA